MTYSYIIRIATVGTPCRRLARPMAIKGARKNHLASGTANLWTGQPSSSQSSEFDAASNILTLIRRHLQRRVDDEEQVNGKAPRTFRTMGRTNGHMESVSAVASDERHNEHRRRNELKYILYTCIPVVADSPGI